MADHQDFSNAPQQELMEGAHMEDRQPPDASKWDTQPTVDLSSPWTSDDGVIQEYPFNHEELAEWLYQRRTGVNKNMVVIGSLVCCIPCVIDAICSLTLCHDHKTIATNQAYGKWVAISKDGVLIYDVANPKGAKGEREFCWGTKTKEIAAKKTEILFPILTDVNVAEPGQAADYRASCGWVPANTTPVVEIRTSNDPQIMKPRRNGRPRKTVTFPTASLVGLQDPYGFQKRVLQAKSGGGVANMAVEVAQMTMEDESSNDDNIMAVIPGSLSVVPM
jgi:hypothetical protein